MLLARTHISTYRDVTTGAGDTLAQRNERNMARIEQITQAGYQVKVQWECDFDKGILAAHAELKLHPVVQHSPLNTRDALYGGRIETNGLHHKAGDGETIQYVDVMSLYPRPSSDSRARCLSGHARDTPERRVNEVFDSSTEVSIPSCPPVSLQ